MNPIIAYAIQSYSLGISPHRGDKKAYLIFKLFEITFIITSKRRRCDNVADFELIKALTDPIRRHISTRGCDDGQPTFCKVCIRLFLVE